MFRRAICMMMTMAFIPLTGALASDAQTSASAGHDRYSRDGTAQATARYDGRIGFARTDTQSGPVSRASGVAVGVDENGLSLSVSNAVSTPRGQSIATSFNLSIDRDGGVSRSLGRAVAQGPYETYATAGGRVGTGRSARPATAFASGKTDRFGRVEAKTDVRQNRPQRIVQRRTAPPELRRRYVHRR